MDEAMGLGQEPDELFDDAGLLLGTLALFLLSTDESDDAALQRHLGAATRNADWRRHARAWELIAAICAEKLPGGLEPPLRDELPRNDLLDQEAVWHMLTDRVRAGRWRAGQLTDELSGAYQHDPAGLSWMMCALAVRAACLLSGLAPGTEDLRHRFGERDEPALFSRWVLDVIAWELAAART